MPREQTAAASSPALDVVATLTFNPLIKWVPIARVVRLSTVAALALRLQRLILLAAIAHAHLQRLGAVQARPLPEQTLLVTTAHAHRLSTAVAVTLRSRKMTTLAPTVRALPQRTAAAVPALSLARTTLVPTAHAKPQRMVAAALLEEKPRTMLKAPIATANTLGLAAAQTA